MERNPQLARVTVQEFQAKYQSKTGEYISTFSNLGFSHRGKPLPGQRLPQLLSTDPRRHDLAPPRPVQQPATTYQLRRRADDPGALLRQPLRRGLHRVR